MIAIILISIGVGFFFGVLMGDSLGYRRGITGPISEGQFERMARERGYIREGR